MINQNVVSEEEYLELQNCYEELQGEVGKLTMEVVDKNNEINILQTALENIREEVNKHV